jgi:hypothetical protein
MLSINDAAADNEQFYSLTIVAVACLELGFQPLNHRTLKLNL